MNYLDLALLLVLMLLASITLSNVSKLAHRWYVPLALVWTWAFILFAGQAGLHAEDIFLTDAVSGLIWGGVCLLVVVLALVLGVSMPRLRPLFADERVTKQSGHQIAFKTLVEVPLGTVVVEEIAFRSVLLGLLIEMYGLWIGVLGSSLVFGLWHILPALEMHNASGLSDRLGSGWRGKLTTVVGNVVATAPAGVVFALLAVGSGSVLAPMMLHWAMNGSGSIAAWLLHRHLTVRGRPPALPAAPAHTDEAEPEPEDDQS